MRDPKTCPNNPKILFIGFKHSTHTHSWMGLLDGAPLEVKLFGLPGGYPLRQTPGLILSAPGAGTPPSLGRRAERAAKQVVAGAVRLALRAVTEGVALDWQLAQRIRRWQPDIIHTLGLDPAGYLYLDARRKYGLAGIGKWVLQTRGGSDLQLAPLDPDIAPMIGEALRACDQLISDNAVNFRIAQAMGVRPEQLSPVAPVPGTGGVDVDALAARWQGQPSARRVIVWPKAYDCEWSVALPVFEALKLCWDRIKPCEVYLLSMIPKTEMWYWALPEEIRQSCYVMTRIPREQVFDLITQARVMLAPSLVDGVPNVLWEAMACGAFPIVSPLASIRSAVNDAENVLFARNLYPHEIAEALARAMTDDALVDAAAARNLALVRRVADRATIAPRVIEYYQKLAGRR